MEQKGRGGHRNPNHACSYPGHDIVANVAYDLFASSTDGGDYEYGFVIWLDALGGSGPISATGSSIAIATLADNSWDVYQGTNSQMTVFSFVATETINSFCGDLIDFVDYLTGNQGVSGSQRIQSVGAGTGPFTGNNTVFATTTTLPGLSTRA